MVTETREPTFDPIPANGSGQIKPPRELSQSPAAIRARANRANAKKSGARPTTRKATTRTRKGPTSLAPEIGAFLSLVNGALIVSPLGTRPIEAIDDPSVTPTKIGDELDAVEINALASAIDAQCKRSPRFRKIVERFLGAGSGGTLVMVAGLIAARRAARHGILPREIDLQAGLILSADVSQLANMAGPNPSTDPDTGETVPDRSVSADE